MSQKLQLENHLRFSKSTKENKFGNEEETELQTQDKFLEQQKNINKAMKQRAKRLQDIRPEVEQRSFTSLARFKETMRQRQLNSETNLIGEQVDDGS